MEEMRFAYAATTYARAEGETAQAGLGQRLDTFFEKQAERAIEKYEQPKPGNLLDVGCGDGRFIASMLRRRWKAEGIETDPVAAGLARQRTGVMIHDVELDTAEMIPHAFQMVSLLHVIEHVPDPRTTLTAAYNALAPGGMLLLALPNAGSWEASLFGTCWYPLDLPRHYWGFSPHTLTRLVEECGYHIGSLEYFPFLFTLQSMRYALRSVSGSPAVPPVAGKQKNEVRGLRTRLFQSLLEWSGTVGKGFPGEIMELVAFKPK
jgi:SAM-dependent methyltransferase